MKYFVTLLSCLLLLNVYSQKEDVKFSNDNFSVEAKKINGLLQGKYISKYPNGKTKAEGEFKNNIRFGIWNVYDTSGNVIQTRDYKNNLEYTRLFPEKAKTGPASLFDTAIYHLSYNKDNYIDYFPLTERMVLYSKRIWREMKTKNNELLFKKDLLFNIISSAVSDTTNSIHAYSVENFQKITSNEDLKKLNPKNYNIISFKIKEDNVFDIERNLAETRIIGICPVGIKKDTKDTVDLFWAYYPQLRSQLASHKLKDKNNIQLNTLEDIFFFRDFTSDIYKESNIYDTDLYAQTKTENELKSRQNEIEVSMIEMEHDVWLGFVPR